MTTQEILAERWGMATRDVRRFANEDGISSVNSPRWEAVQEALEELAALLVVEVVPEEADDLTRLTEDIWRETEARMLAWAEAVEERRAAQRKGAAA